MNLVSWIDKKINEIKDTDAFLEYFAGIKMTKIDIDRYLFNDQKGIDIVMSEELIVHSIHLFSGNTPESKEFRNLNLHNLSFDMNQANVQIILGQANKSGGGYRDIFGNVPMWDKFYFSSYSLHLQYSPVTGAIDIITIGSLSLEPYLNSNLQ